MKLLQQQGKETAAGAAVDREGVMILIFLLAVVLPLSTSFWIVSLILAATSGGEYYEPISPARWLMAVLMPVVIACYGLKKRSVDCSGAITGLFVGFVITLSSYCFLASLLSFFLTASKATKFRSHRKQKLEDDFKEGGQRNWVQVLCNGGVATEIALIYMIDRGCGENVLDFVTDYRGSWLAMSVLGAIACANGDTWASELGSVVGKGLPVLITSGKRVPRGTNGAVTPAGLLFSALGGLAVGVAYYCALLLCVHPHVLMDSPPQWPVIVVGMLAGLIGSTIDSFLGATLQFSDVHPHNLTKRHGNHGLDQSTGKVVEHDGTEVKHITGTNFLDNHSVNLVSTVITALITPGVAMSLWTFI